MKLAATLAQELQVETGSRAIPHDAPVAKKLYEQFGEHSFFIDNDGLHVWEIENEGSNDALMVAVQVAAWEDDKRSVLVPHNPKPIRTLGPDFKPVDPAA